MPLNATSTAWKTHTQVLTRIDPHQRKRRQKPDDTTQTANVTKERRNEDQSDEPICRRPGKGPALLYRSAGLRKKGRLQPGTVSLAHSGLSRRPGRYGAAAGA